MWFLSSLQASVPAWLSALGLSQYEGALLDAGYDDIDFVCEISIDELCDIGITMKGRFNRDSDQSSWLCLHTCAANITVCTHIRYTHVTQHDASSTF